MTNGVTGESDEVLTRVDGGIGLITLNRPKAINSLNQQMVDDLQYGLQDPADVVRANAMRALKAVRVGAKLHPEQGITVLPTWYVELLIPSFGLTAGRPAWRW